MSKRKGKQLERKCKLCTHELRVDTEMMILTGSSLRDAETFIATNIEDKNDKVSYVTIQKHMNSCVDDKYKIKLKYLEEKRKLANGETIDENDVVGLQFKELLHIDDAIKECALLVKASSHELKRQLNEKIKKNYFLKDEKGRIVSKKQIEEVNVKHAVVTLFNSSASELRQQILTKQKMLGDDKPSVGESVETLVDLVLGGEE